MTDEVAKALPHGVLERANSGEPARILEHLVSDVAALGTVTVEQLIPTGSANNQSQLPGEVEGILHAGIHALPARGAVNMRRISYQEYGSRAVVRNLAAIDPETREPNGIIGNQTGWPAPSNDRLRLFQCRCRGALGLGEG